MVDPRVSIVVYLSVGSKSPKPLVLPKAMSIELRPKDLVSTESVLLRSAPGNGTYTKISK